MSPWHRTVLWISLFSCFAAAQTPVINSVVNGASFSGAVTAGSFAAIFGSNLASATASAATQTPWPTTLAGTSVQVGGIAAPLSFVSPSQVNIQIPWQLGGFNTSVAVTTASGTSSSFSVSLRVNPGLFSMSSGAGFLLHASNQGVDAGNPALPGEIVRVFATGLGPVSNQPATGFPPSGPSPTTSAPTVKLGGISAQVQSAQLTPTADTAYIGLSISTYEIAFTVPGNVPPGNAVMLSVATTSSTGAVSNTVTVPVAPPVPAISLLSPATAVASGPAFTLTVNGSNFASNSQVRWNGNGRTTTFVSATQLTAAIAAADIAVSGSATITVATGTSVSSASTFAITAPVVTPNPASLAFTVTEGNNPAAQSITVSGTNGSSFTAAATTTTGGSWLAVSPGAGLIPASTTVTVTSSNLVAGTYLGSVTLQAGGVNTPVAVTLTVNPAPAGQISVTPASLSIQAQVGASPIVRYLTVGNTGSTNIAWTASATTSNGGPWLTVAPASGSAGLHSPSSLQATIDLQGLQPGVYDGTIGVDPGGVNIAVRLALAPSAPIMVVGQSGLVLTGIAGAGSPPAQSVIVANTGGGTFNWTDAVVRGTGLGVQQSGGTSAAQASTLPTFTVKANTSGLVAGSYYGLIQVAAPNVTNSPQSLSVIVNLLASGSTTPPRVFPQGLIFVAPVGVTPAAQTINLATASATSVTVNTSVATQSGGNWLSVSPGSTPLAPTSSLAVNAGTTGLKAGVYSGTVTVIPNDGSSAQDVTVYLVVTVGPEAEALRLGASATCAATKLVMTMRLLSSNFTSPVGWPVNLEAQVVDDCGTPQTGATTIATFSNGDAPLSLVHIGNGIYSATWKPAAMNATTVTVQAFQPPLATATLAIAGHVGPNTVPPPSIGTGGVVNAASFAPGAELAPGTIVSVFGSNLASSDGNLAGFPLPNTLANVKLTIGGVDAPLFYAGKGQVNAQIPFELTPGTQSQVTARVIPASGAELDAVPEPILIGAVRPGIFIASGTQGAILNVANQVVDSTHPATANDVIVIFCTGLGATTPAAQTGQPATGGTAVVQPAVTVGGVSAPVQYAGVAPGFVGLYQVNVQIPNAVTTGPAVQVLLTQNGISSNPATIAIK